MSVCLMKHNIKVYTRMELELHALTFSLQSEPSIHAHLLSPGDEPPKSTEQNRPYKRTGRFEEEKNVQHLSVLPVT